jgi:hypothetical protein
MKITEKMGSTVQPILLKYSPQESQGSSKQFYKYTEMDFKCVICTL